MHCTLRPDHLLFNWQNGLILDRAIDWPKVLLVKTRLHDKFNCHFSKHKSLKKENSMSHLCRTHLRVLMINRGVSQAGE